MAILGMGPYHTRMRVSDALHAGIDRTDAEILLTHLLGKPRTWLLAHDEEPLSSAQEDQWVSWIARRKTGEPVAYIVGSKEFHGRLFSVTPSVLIPRPATETLIEATLEFLKKPGNAEIEADQEIVIVVRLLRNETPRLVADIGTGSGCIAITLALETELDVIGTDISAAALEVAKFNATTLKARVDWRHGDALDPLRDLTRPFLLVSNPPYIRDDAELMRDVAHFEPHDALFGGSDGANIVRRITIQAMKHPQCVGLIMECRSEHTAIIDALIAARRGDQS